MPGRRKRGPMRLSRPMPRGDLLDVGVGGLAQVGDGVDEGDFERQKCVGGVLDDLGRLGRGVQQGRRGGGEQAPGNGVSGCE
jgi:hypothetical protein